MTSGSLLDMGGPVLYVWELQVHFRDSRRRRSPAQPPLGLWTLTARWNRVFSASRFWPLRLVSYHRLITQLFYLRSSKWFLCSSVSTYRFGGISPWNPCSLDEIWLLPSCCWSLLAPPHIFNCLRWWFSFPAGHILSLASASDFSGSAAGQGEPNVLSQAVTIRISSKHRTFL